MNLTMPTLTQITVGFAILGAIVCIALNRSNLASLKLEEVVLKILGASAIPNGVLLLAAAFDDSLLKRVSDAGIYLVAAGAALLFVSVKELLKKQA